MVRPRWHDALIITAIVGVLSFGALAIWWDDVWAFWGKQTGSQTETEQGTPQVTPGKV